MSTTTPLPRTSWTSVEAGTPTDEPQSREQVRTKRTSRRAAAFTVLLGLGLVSAFFGIQLLLTDPSNHTERPLFAALAILFLVSATRVAGPRTLSNTGL